MALRPSGPKLVFGFMFHNISNTISGKISMRESLPISIFLIDWAEFRYQLSEPKKVILKLRRNDCILLSLQSTLHLGNTFFSTYNSHLMYCRSQFREQFDLRYDLLWSPSVP